MDKYANLNLPGIAKNEPDVYETFNSNPIQSRDTVEDDSPNVEKINISSKDAHDKFNKKILNSNFADFSDTITNKKKFGYMYEPEVFEWNQDAGGESPLQRFKRLEAELTELKSDLNEMEKNIKSGEGEKPEGFEPADLVGEVEKLQKQINTLHLQSIGAGKSVSDLDSKAKKQLLVDYLEEIKRKLSQKQNGEKTSEKQETSIVFKLFADLEKSDLDRANKLAELNQRLNNLEKIFGAGSAANESQIAKLCSNIENKSVLGFVENLNSRMSLVENQSLDLIESRLQMITQRVNQLNEKKGLVEDHEKLSRVNELYNMLCNWKDMSILLPSIVDRLSALNDLHQKAFEFASMLSRLDKEQEAMKQSIETGTKALETLKSNFESNLESIKTNFEHLNERMINIGGKSSKA